MIRSSRFRRPIYAAGTLLAGVALAYLAYLVFENWSAISGAQIRNIDPVWMLVAAISYALSLVTTTLVWPLILGQLKTHLPLRLALGIGLVSQSGKYLPGNIAHYLGRAALASRSGVSFRTSGVSTAVEFGSALIAAAIVTVAAAALYPQLVLAIHEQMGYTANGWILGTIAALLVMALWICMRVPRLAPLLRPNLWGLPILLLICSFVLAGISFFAVVAAVDEGAQLSVGTAIAVYAIAWVAGFIVPGAPAGVGIREAVIVGFLSLLVGAAAALLCALLHRFVTAVADGLMAVVGAAVIAQGKMANAG